MEREEGGRDVVRCTTVQLVWYKQITTPHHTLPCSALLAILSPLLLTRNNRGLHHWSDREIFLLPVCLPGCSGQTIKIWC